MSRSETECAEREQLIMDHSDMARRIAKRMARRCPGWVAVDDLVSAGMLGLIEAAQRYDGSRAEPFGAFAEHRIRGAILDELRRGDIMPRRTRQTARRIASAIRTIENAGETATDEKVAEAIGVPVERYRNELAGLTSFGMDALDEMSLPAREEASLEDQLAHRHMVDRVRRALTTLRARDVAILGMHYLEELTFAEIAATLGVTASRVCQLLRRAVDELRVELGAQVSD